MRIALACLVVCVAVSPLVGQTIPLTPAEQRFLAEHPRIRLMVDPHYEPADFIDDKTRQHSGMAADLLNLLSQRTGLNFVPVPLDAEGRRELDPIKRGVDGVALSSLNDQRSEFYLSTEPILEFPAYILSRKSAFDRFVTPLDLHGMTVAVVSGYAVVDYLKEHYPQIILKEFPTTNDGLKALSYDEVHAMVASIPTSTYWLEKEGYANLKIAGESGFIYRLGVTSRKDWPELHSILQKGVASLTPAERDEVRRKWLNAPYEPFFRSWYFWRPVLIIILILLAAIVIILFFNQLLRNRVRKRTRELAESEKLYRLTLTAISDAVLLVREDQSIALASPGAARIFGLSETELAQSTIKQLLGDAWGVENPPVVDRHAQYRLPSGEEKILQITSAELKLHDACRVYVCRDLTKTYHLERELRQKRTLESVGMLASGVAHDFNNLLQIIHGFTEQAGMARLPDDLRMKYLEYISDATRRAGDLTQQLLAFARRKETPVGPIDVHTVTSTFLPLVEKVQGFARLNYLPPPEPLSILLDPTQLEQIILNLVVNARDAMPRGGVITLSWERITRDGQDEACLKVADTGIGIPPEVMSKIFEPFFTTKDPGKGTGLGLAVVKEIVTEARGRLEVFSTPGVGTRLELSFPINTPA